jgi:aspartate racemase
MTATVINTPAAMRRIGLIGGITWPATADYFRYINLDVRRRLGGDHSAEMIIRSLDLHPLRAHANDVPAIEQELLAAGRALQAGGAELIAVASFTGHRYAGPLRRLPLPFVDLVDVLGEQAWSHGFRRIAVWATSYAAADGALLGRLAEGAGAELLLPQADEQRELDRIVFDELAAQRLAPGSTEFVRALLARQARAGAQSLLLATTDFSPLAAVLGTTLPLLDASVIHCAALVDAALG